MQAGGKEVNIQSQRALSSGLPALVQILTNGRSIATNNLTYFL